MRLSCVSGSTVAVSIVLEAGYDVNKKISRWTPLMAAANSGNPTTVRVMLKVRWSFHCEFLRLLGCQFLMA